MAEMLKKIPQIIPSMKEPTDEYPVTFRFENFGFSADLAIIANQWNRVGAYTVEAGMEYCVGRRYDGFIYILLKDTGGVTQYGRVRLVVANPTETKKQVVYEGSTRTMGDVADKAKKPILPLSPPWVTQDSKIILEVDPEANFTLDYGQTLSAIDVTSRVVK